MTRTNIEIRKPTERDMRMLVANLRPADQEELKAYFSDDFDFIVKTSVKYSRDAWSVIVNGKLLFICGVGRTSLIGDVGCPWLLGTTHISQFPKEFYKQSLQIVNEIRQNYKLLINHVYTKNTVAIRYLKRMGFELKDPVPHGANGELFHPFGMVTP